MAIGLRLDIMDIGDKYCMSVYEPLGNITSPLEKMFVCNLVRADGVYFRDFGNTLMRGFRNDIWDKGFVW